MLLASINPASIYRISSRGFSYLISGQGASVSQQPVFVWIPDPMGVAPAYASEVYQP